MKKLFNEVSGFITGQPPEPANPDPAHNSSLLKNAKSLIESGILTRFFKRPAIYILEGAAYIATFILLLTGFYFWKKIDNLFDAAATIDFFSKLFSETDLHLDDAGFISYIILLIFMLPSLICFLLGRSLSASRKRINRLITVEDTLSLVIHNLSEAK